MKKITITTLLLAIIIFSQAQENQSETKTSKFVLGGNIAFEYSHNKIDYFQDQTATSVLFSLKPYVGVVVGKNFTVGLKIGYTHYNDYNNGERRLNTKGSYNDYTYEVHFLKGDEFAIIPFLRYSNKILKGRLNYFFDFNAGYNFSSNMEAEFGYYSNIPYSPYKYSNYFFCSDFGLLYNFNQNFGLEFTLSFFQIEFISEDFEIFDGEFKYKTFDIKLLPELFRPNLGVNIKL